MFSQSDAQQPLSRSPMNVLFITVDQWRGDLLPGENSWVRTPNLNDLAAAGTRFTRHYCQAYPCGPARASLITGLYAHKHRSIQNGTPLDARHQTIFQIARQAGYRPTLFGYTDTTPDPRGLHPNDPSRGEYEGVAAGLDIGCLLTEKAGAWIADLLRKGYDISEPDKGRGRVFDMAALGAPTTFKAEDSETAFLTDRVLDFLAVQGEVPFFLHVSYIAPHPPFAAARDWLDLVAADDIPDPVAFGTADMSHPLLDFYRETVDLSSFVPGLAGPVAKTSIEQARLIRRIYAALCAEVDHHIGRIFNRLRSQGLWENTLVIFSGDHGEQLFDQLLLGKLGWHDASAHIPLIIRHPGHIGGQRVEQFTQSIDVFPTILEALGIPRHDNLNGDSLLPFCSGEKTEAWRSAVHWSHDFRNLRDFHFEKRLCLASRDCTIQVLRTDKFKYVHSPALPAILHDLENDPFEQVNRAQDKSYRDYVELGMQQLLNLRLRHEDETLSHYQAIDSRMFHV